MDPLDVPLLIRHDFGKCVLHNSVYFRKLAMTAVLVHDTLFEHLRDAEYFHQIAWRPRGGQILILIG